MLYVTKGNFHDGCSLAVLRLEKQKRAEIPCFEIYYYKPFQKKKDPSANTLAMSHTIARNSAKQFVTPMKRWR